MPQLVFEFWSPEIEPVAEAIVRVLDGRPTENVAATNSLQYEPTQQGLDWAAQQISNDKLSSFALHPLNGGIRYALLHGPGIDGDNSDQVLWARLNMLIRITFPFGRNF